MGEVDGSPTDRRGAGPSVDVVADNQPGPLNDIECRQVGVVRRLGTVGALLLAAGSLGAGASPVFNPLTTVPVIGLFSRMPTVALACAFSGMGLVVLAWLWLGRFVRPGRDRLLSRGQFNRTLVTWTAPLVLVPPMFSRDVYSYLAQSKIAQLGLNPYQLGPATALGVANPLTRGVPNIWRDTPAPYGPLFIGIGRAITRLSGEHVVTGVYLQRLLELVGIAMIVWALPRLARRFGVQPVSALWLGVANPLVLWHLVIGSHNEALMIGLMLTGFEIALRQLPTVPPGEPIPPVTQAELCWLILGTSVIALGAAIKISAAPALGFLGVMVARRWGGGWRHLTYAALLLAAVSGTIIVGTSVGTGLGFGWVGAMNTNGLVKSWLSPVTSVGFLAGGLGIALGLGNHTDTTISTMRTLGAIGSVVISAKLLWDGYRGRLAPMMGLGLCLAVVVVLGATVQPWYLLWAAIPLAAATSASRFRSAAAAVSAVVAMLVPPTGASFDGRGYVIPEAAVAAAIVVAVAVLAVRQRLPILLPRPAG